MADEVGSIAELGQLLQTLRDSHSDLQTAADHAIESKDVDELTAALKKTLGALDTAINGTTAVATSLAAVKGAGMTPGQEL